jgi:NAD-dependent DNA ligase
MDSLSDLVGQANSESILKHKDKFARLVYIRDKIIWKNPKETEKSKEAKGKVAITGKLSVKRSEFEKELKSAGFTPADISKDTKFLITDDPHSSSSKNKKASDWGIEKLSEHEFRSRYLK